MLVSSNSLLNILLPNDNKALKDVLKEADSKTLQQMVNNKSVSVNDVLKNLFDEVKNGTKSNTNIQNLLKNSNLFKDLGSFSKSLTTLLNQVDADSNLSKYKPLLQSFLKDISSLDANTLKEQISKSGVFLESKIAEQNTSKNTAIPKSLINLLNQIQTALKDLNIPQAKQINELINKIIEPNINNQSTNTQSNLKSLVSLLQNINTSLSSPSTKNISELTNQLKSMMGNASLVESKLQNNNPNIEQNNIKQQINEQTKNILSQIKNEVLANPKQAQNTNILNQLDNLIKSSDLFSKNQNSIEPKNLLNNLLNSRQLNQASTQNPNISNLVSNLKNISDNISNLESKVLNSQNITTQKESLITNLKENLANLKNELVNVKNIDLKQINQVISKLENIQNIFTKIEMPANILQNPTQNANISIFPNNFTNNLNTLFLLLKENITNLSSNQNVLSTQNQISNIVDKIETIIKENLSSLNTNINPNQTIQKNDSNPLANDMKSILLQMQDDIASKMDNKSQDLSKQVEKMLMQIDYHQLLSSTSNSNYVYVPFLWDMLEDGTIDMKKIDEDKFYCQINLTLKDFGKVDLMLALYDKNKLDLTIKAQREHFKESIRDNIQKLKQNLNSVDLIPVNIKLLDLKEEQTSEDTKTQAFVNTYEDQLNTNIDIRA